MIIRPERAGDEDAIHALTASAFESMPFSDGSEAPIIRALRRSGQLSLSLVAQLDDRIVGHVAFSAVTIDGRANGWFGLGPIAVDRGIQRSGIGRALVASGLATLRERGAAGCALIGNPAIYSRFGFESDGKLTYEDLPSHLVQWVRFFGPTPRGALKFASSFEAGNY
ncbi:N-acetyltransferase [Devosia sp. LC5]|uniref:GNAT family N-acetyltransferase n=1 Tax=Devosia sp. LC5 TaxID=1502724 RepID=UPI00054F47D2|nr:N-acetyltransferase [Devosia sp. LC5]